MQEGIEKMLQSEDGLIRIKALLTSSVELEMAQVKEMNNLQKEKGSLETQLANVKSKNKDGDIALLNEQEAKIKAEIADTDRLIKQKRDYIKEMREERKTIYEIQKVHKEKKETIKEVIKTKKEEIPVAVEATKAVEVKIETEKKGITEVAEVQKKANEEQVKQTDDKVKKQESTNQNLLSISQALLDGQEQQKAAAAEKENQRIEAQKLKTEQANEAGSFLVDVMKDVASSTGQAKEEAGGMAEELKKSSEAAKEVLKTMVQIGNISAAKGGGTKSGLGEFSSASDALANLPGSKSYSGGGSGFGLGRGGTEGMGNIPSFATSAGSSSASTAISTTNKTNANIAFNFGDTNITKNMPQNVVDSGKTLASWAMGVQLRGARS
jgi:myosin heavy subunit